MRYNPIADYDPDRRELYVLCPTPEVMALGRALPAPRRYDEKTSRWVSPATPAMVARVGEIWGRTGLDATPAFKKYMADSIWRAQKAHEVLNAKRWPPIPITAEQPTGKWMHQRKAFWFAYQLEASLLAITMGGGKTKIAIDLMQNWNARKVLVIAPLAACEDAWLPQLHRYMVGPYVAARSFSGTMFRRMEAADYAIVNNDHQHGIVLINHEAFWREPMRSYLLSVEWDLIIGDELHREKSAGSKQSVFLGQLAQRAKRRLGLTGTPMPHSPLDVYGQFRFLDRGIYGSHHESFEQKYAIYGGFQFREVIGFKNMDDLQRKFFSISLVIDDSEQGLPETVDITHSVKLDFQTKRIYDNMDKEFMAEVKEGSATAANAGVKLLRLHQIACGILKLDAHANAKRVGTEKMQALSEVISDLPDKEPVVIFTRFTPDTNDVCEFIRTIDGDVSELSGNRHELQDWKQGKTRVLVAQIQAAKEGIDLTRAAVAIFYSTGISLGDYLQCRKRLHRPPQKRMVRFIHLIASGTRDVSTMRSLEKRHDVVKDVLQEITAIS